MIKYDIRFQDMQCLAHTCQNLYYLDSDWAKTICSRLVKSKETKIAFWEGYVSNKIYNNIFKDLQSLYDEFLNGAISNEISRKTIHKITIRHMLLAYNL